MRRFNINVNGTAYDVQVEEVGGNAPMSAPVTAPAPTPTPTATPTPAPVSAAPVGEGTKVDAPMPGNIVDVKVNVGDTVKSGDVLILLEAMKMENDIVAPCDGKVTSVTVKKGDTVNSNDTLATVG